VKIGEGLNCIPLPIFTHISLYQHSPIFAKTRQTKSPKLALGASVYGGFLGLNLCDL
jgi:hypothetical protein